VNKHAAILNNTGGTTPGEGTMDLHTTTQTNSDRRFVELAESGTCILRPQDMLDVMAWGGEQDTSLFLLQEEHFPPAFYDLKTGFAGEILQKLTNYGCRLAIVGSFAGVRSPRFRELMREANKGRQVRFAATRDEAIAWLTQ
jgi:hypothetical protein